VLQHAVRHRGLRVKNFFFEKKKQKTFAPEEVAFGLAIAKRRGATLDFPDECGFSGIEGLNLA